jgi:DNA-binding IscR family transcriptional regulator
MESKVTSSGRNTMHVILDYIKSSKEPIHINDIEQYSEDQNIPAQLFEQIFDRMKRMGEVIESKARFYKYNDI